jgi:hypothetical protein
MIGLILIIILIILLAAIAVTVAILDKNKAIVKLLAVQAQLAITDKYCADLCKELEEKTRLLLLAEGRKKQAKKGHDLKKKERKQA